ncbi:circularly permuted type 2 ATP-grasp protein [Micromonospora sp. M12]
MIYFDVRPSAHVPLWSCGSPTPMPTWRPSSCSPGCSGRWSGGRSPPCVPGWNARRYAHRCCAAVWQAARSGLEGDLLDLPRSARPVPAAQAVRRLVTDLRPQLEATGDWEQISELTRYALERGSSAARQRRAYERRGRLADVVDLLLDETRVGSGCRCPVRRHRRHCPRTATSATRSSGRRDRSRRTPDARCPAPTRCRRPAPAEHDRDEEQRARGVTFSVAGEASTRLFPVDLVPRVVPAADWRTLRTGLVQRARALDAFLRDVYADRAVVADGVVPAWVVESSPGLRPTGALMGRRGTRAQVSGTDLVRDPDGGWYVLEDNLRVPSGIGYAVQNRRLTQAVLPELPVPEDLLPADETRRCCTGRWSPPRRRGRRSRRGGAQQRPG